MYKININKNIRRILVGNVYFLSPRIRKKSTLPYVATNYKYYLVKKKGKRNARKLYEQLYKY